MASYTRVRYAVANAPYTRCPEASVEAMNVALDQVKDHGVIFFSTDASPYHDADMDALAARLKTQQVKFNAVVSGDGGDKDSWNEVK